MNNLINTRSVSASAFVTMAVVGFMSLGGSTQASANVLSCSGQTFNSAVACCEQMSRSQRPSWMLDTDSTCKAVVKCYSGINAASIRRCRVVLSLIEDNEKHGGKTPPSRQARR